MLVHSDALWITARQQRRTRRRTHGRGDHETRELPAFGRQAIDVWRFDCLGSKAAEIAVTLVVDKDDDEIGLFGLSDLKHENADENGEKKLSWFHVATRLARRGKDQAIIRAE